jgi:uncharacterized protein YecE (DUF72 family)
MVRGTNDPVGRIRVGVGGWSFPPWRALFYPPGLRQADELGFMAAALDSVEINATFYRLQKTATFQHWRDATPESFVFSVKAPRFVTQRSDLATAGESIEKFLDSGVMELGSKLGAINWQLPPGKPFVAAEIEAFLGLLPRRHARRPLRHAIEVRHASFHDKSFTALARQHDAAIVVAGDSAHPHIDEATAPFHYLRVMGTKDRLREGYTAAALARWATRAQALAGGGRDVYLYVISGAKRRNPAAALALQRLLAPAG